MRSSGILCPISSLSSRYGIGCLSKEAYDFVDFLKESGQTYWQILPFGPTGFGDSPYQSFSTFAGNPYFICLESLIDDGLLKKEECDAADFGNDPKDVDYGKLYMNRYPLLKLASERFFEKPDEEYASFINENADWLEDYGLYMAVKQDNGGRSWLEWEDDFRLRKPEVLEKEKEKLGDEIKFVYFQQYMFFKQWKKFHIYTKKQGIKIIGDIPFYVASDSADTWANPELFQFDADRMPSAVAGCPPDAFSADGQLWGNPLYNWDYLKETRYEWWVRRISHALEICDVLRVDHFRAFDEYYSIPYGDKTAVNGKWKKGPGIGLFHAVREKLGEVQIIAEDLGYITESVRELVKETGYPSMKVLQFAFDGSEKSEYLPYNCTKNAVIYTGTHDNETTRGWFEDTSDHDRDFARRYMNSMHSDAGGFVWGFIRLAQASVCDTCIVPIQDYLVKGNEARINFPSTTGTNWRWRLVPNELSSALAASIFDMTQVYGRLPVPETPETDEDEAESGSEAESEK
ncbi:MAG TPA: 4-alpha-glucanotransferase [Lachnospiraceae bacterium]|nr:4-alpha-glucanotransferase [Lachnospiraceae bacterium]